jgi:hypothetical protein
VLSNEVLPWLLQGNAWVFRMQRLVRAFMEVFGSAAGPDNWEGRGVAPVGLDTYLELSLTLFLAHPVYLKFIVPYENPQDRVVGMMASFEPFKGDVPAHLYWRKLPVEARHEFDVDCRPDLVGVLSMLKSRSDAATVVVSEPVQCVTLKGRQP